MANPYEEAARRKKAERVAAHMHARGQTPEDARMMDAETWQNLAMRVGVRRIHDVPATALVVAEILRELKEAECQTK